MFSKYGQKAQLIYLAWLGWQSQCGKSHHSKHSGSKGLIQQQTPFVFGFDIFDSFSVRQSIAW